MVSSERQSPIEVDLGYKFAVIALSHSRGGGAPAPLISLRDGFAVSDALPTNALDTWRDDIGRFHSEELEGSRLFLWALAQSATPAVLDQENEALAKDVYRLYIGLLLATPFFSSGRLTRITGANADGTARARSLTTFDRTFYTLGAPPSDLSSRKVRLAADLAAALRQHDESPDNRIVRSLRAFCHGCEASDLDLRLHQFVRSAEGFAVPPFGNSAEHFAERLSRVCAGPCRRHLKELYRIRSGIEHLHGPFDRLPASLSKRRKRERLLMRCVEAETLAGESYI